MTDPVIDTSLFGTPADPLPDVIRLSDLLDAKAVLQQQESADSAALNGISSCSLDVLRPKLLAWVQQGLPNAWCLFSVPVKDTYACSDGVQRTLPEYIVFCSGKTLQEHVSLLQAKLPDIHVGFLRATTALQFVVTNPG